MIFLTLGTHQPFDRLVRIVDRWCGDNPDTPVFGQVPFESDSYRPANFEATEHLHIAQYRERFRTADFVVAHAGMGSIITALCLTRPIIIFPRRAALREQRNDHQLATAARFEGRAGVRVAYDEDDLLDAMDACAARVAEPEGDELGPFADPRLTDALRAAIVRTGSGHGDAR